MKTKINIPNRGRSNPPRKNNNPPSALLEEETRKMEAKLKDLRDFMANEQAKRESLGSAGGTRWRGAADNVPIKNYGKAVLEGKVRTVASAKTNKENFSNTNANSVAEPKKMLIDKVLSTNTSFQSKKSEKRRIPTPTQIKRQQSSTPRSENSILKTETSIPKNETSIAEFNLKKAMQSQKENDEVDVFFEELKLPQYISVFRDGGFDDLETLMDVDSKFLEQMKIPPGHQIKITKKLEKLRAEIKGLNGMNSSARNSPEKANLVIKEPRKQNNPFSQQTELQMKTSSSKPAGGMREMSDGIGVGTDDGPGSLLNGQFDEKESHQSFLEALHEWRKGKNPPTDTASINGVAKPATSDKQESKTKTVRFNDGTEPKRPAKGQEGVNTSR